MDSDRTLLMNQSNKPTHNKFRYQNREALSTSKIQSYSLGSIKGMLLMEHVGIARPILSFILLPFISKRYSNIQSRQKTIYRIYLHLPFDLILTVSRLFHRDNRETFYYILDWGLSKRKNCLFFQFLFLLKTNYPSNLNLILIECLSTQSETLVSLYTKYLPPFPLLLILILFPSGLSNLIQDSASRHYTNTSSGRDSGSFDSPSYTYTIIFSWILSARIYSLLQNLEILKIKQVSTVLVLFLCFCWAKIRRVISAEEGIPSLLLIRRHPDLNWGKGICSPPPYHSAMPPKQYKIDGNIPFLGDY